LQVIGEAVARRRASGTAGKQRVGECHCKVSMDRCARGQVGFDITHEQEKLEA
jgi:hypothetical protein